MRKGITIGLVLLALAVILAGCASQASAVKSVPVPLAQSNQSVAEQATLSEPVATVTVSKSSSKPAGPIEPKEITVAISGDSISIPVDIVEANWNSHFLVKTSSGTMGFMAYVLNDEVYIRASICPPCRGKTYALDGDNLVCDTCATVFSAKTGAGISGACVNYPKASVSYQTSGGNIVMKVSDLVTAYQDTLIKG
jgi:hypothetical protein